jgi:hypothetical protein
MKERFHLTRKLTVCPHCAREARGRGAGRKDERELETGLPDLLAELRRNFRYEADPEPLGSPFDFAQGMARGDPFRGDGRRVEPVWAEAVGP